MDGHSAERYYSRRVRRLDERRARQEEWDFLASRLIATEITEGVGPGWRPLVHNLHDQLLELDPNYRLYSVGEVSGGLDFVARTSASTQGEAARRIHAARAEALDTCEACGDSGTLRPERLQMKTLCDECWVADRTAATARGERYADAVMAELLSSDPDHPSAEEILHWLDELDAS